MNNLEIQQDNREDISIDLKEIFSKIIDKWYLFLIAIIISVLGAYMYIRFTPPKYQINAKVLVDDAEKGGGLGKQDAGLMDWRLWI